MGSIDHPMGCLGRTYPIFEELRVGVGGGVGGRRSLSRGLIGYGLWGLNGVFGVVFLGRGGGGSWVAKKGTDRRARGGVTKNRSL